MCNLLSPNLGVGGRFTARKELRYQFYIWLSGLQDRSGWVWRREIIFHPGVWTPDCPVHTVSWYRLRYTGSYLIFISIRNSCLPLVSSLQMVHAKPSKSACVKFRKQFILLSHGSSTREPQGFIFGSRPYLQIMCITKTKLTPWP